MNTMDQLVLLLELDILDQKHGKLAIEKPIKISPKLSFCKETKRTCSRLSNRFLT